MAVVVALAQCETLGETQSKNGHNPKVMPVVFIGGVPWRAATIAMLSENAQCAFYGRIRFRPYVRSLVGEACLAPTRLNLAQS